MPLMLIVNNLNVVKYWADASYAMHTNFWSHTGATISLGFVSVASVSKRKNINSRSSMETEIIGADHVLHEFLWPR